MKKLMAFLLCAVLLCGMTACNSSEKDGGKAVVTAADVTLVPGDTGTLSIKLEHADKLKKYGNGKLGGFQFKVIYDPEQLQLGDAVLTIDSIADEENSWTLDYSDKKDGSAMVMILDNNLVGLAADSVPLIDLPIKLTDDASGDSEVRFEIVSICDTKGDVEVCDHIESGSATVTS